MDRVSRDLAAAYPAIDSDKKANILSLKDEMVGRMRPIPPDPARSGRFRAADLLRKRSQSSACTVHGAAA